jgi:hypothetical protein
LPAPETSSSAPTTAPRPSSGLSNVEANAIIVQELRKRFGIELREHIPTNLESEPEPDSSSNSSIPDSIDSSTLPATAGLLVVPSTMPPETTAGCQTDGTTDPHHEGGTISSESLSLEDPRKEEGGPSGVEA